MRPQIGKINITLDDKLYAGTYPNETEGLASLIQPGDRPAYPYSTVFFRPNAVRQLLSFIHWGEKTAENMREQVMVPYGYISADGEDLEHPETGRIWSMVVGVIPVRTPQSTGTTVIIEAGEWQKAVREIDLINNQRKEEDKTGLFQPLGWIHTHPGWLDPFFSMTDEKYQPSYVGSMYRFGAVFNPHRQIWTVYAGPKSVSVKGILQLDDELRQMYSFEARSVDDIREKRPVQVFRHDNRSRERDDADHSARDWPAWRGDVSERRYSIRPDGTDSSDFSARRTAVNAHTLIWKQEQDDWKTVPYKYSFSLDSLFKLRTIQRSMPPDTPIFILVRLNIHEQGWQQGYTLTPLAVLPTDAQWMIPRKEEDLTGAALFIKDRDLEKTRWAFYQGKIHTNGEDLFLITEDLSVYICQIFSQ